MSILTIYDCRESGLDRYRACSVVRLPTIEEGTMKWIKVSRGDSNTDPAPSEGASRHQRGAQLWRVSLVTALLGLSMVIAPTQASAEHVLRCSTGGDLLSWKVCATVLHDNFVASVVGRGSAYMERRGDWQAAMRIKFTKCDRDYTNCTTATHPWQYWDSGSTKSYETQTQIRRYHCWRTETEFSGRPSPSSNWNRIKDQYSAWACFNDN